MTDAELSGLAAWIGCRISGLLPHGMSYTLTLMSPDGELVGMLMSGSVGRRKASLDTAVKWVEELVAESN